MIPVTITKNGNQHDIEVDPLAVIDLADGNGYLHYYFTDAIGDRVQRRFSFDLSGDASLTAVRQAVRAAFIAEKGD